MFSFCGILNGKLCRSVTKVSSGMKFLPWTARFKVFCGPVVTEYTVFLGFVFYVYISKKFIFRIPFSALRHVLNLIFGKMDISAFKALRAKTLIKYTFSRKSMKSELRFKISAVTVDFCHGILDKD